MSATCLQSLVTRLALIGLAGIPIADAQPGITGPRSIYPSGPMTMVVPAPAGGGADLVGRSLAQKLGEAWGQTLGEFAAFLLVETEKAARIVKASGMTAND